jgi:hypothetical protein
MQGTIPDAAPSSPLPSHSAACAPPLTAPSPSPPPVRLGLCSATPAGANHADGCEQRHRKKRAHRHTSRYRRRSRATSEHLEAIFTALGALQNHTISALPDTHAAAGYSGSNDDHQPLSPAASHPPFTLRDGAAVWMCNWLELRWETAIGGAERDGGHMSRAWRRQQLSGASFPSLSPPLTQNTSKGRNDVDVSAHAAARDGRDRSGAAEWEEEAEADETLRVARARSRLIVRLLAFDVLRVQRQRRKRRRAGTLTDVPTKSDVCTDVPPSTTAETTSPLVRQWLWRRAAALPRLGQRAAAASSSSSYLRGELRSVLVEWLALELEDSVAAAAASSAAGVPSKGHASPPRALVGDALKTSLPSSSERARDGAAKVDNPSGLSIVAKVEPKEEEEPFLWPFTRAAVACTAGREEEEGDGAGRMSLSTPPGALPVGGASTLAAASDVAAPCRPSATSPPSASSEVRAPVQRILRLGVVGQPPVKRQVSPGEFGSGLGDTSVTTVCADVNAANGGGGWGTTDDYLRDAQDGAVQTSEEEVQGRDVLELPRSSPYVDVSNSVSSATAGGTRRFTLQLFQPHAVPAPPAPRNGGDTTEEEEEEERLLPFKDQDNRGRDSVTGGARTCEVGGPNSDAPVEAGEVFRKVPAVVYAARAARHARWRRLAPYILYAPHGSTTEDGMRTVLRALGFVRRPRSQVNGQRADSGREVVSCCDTSASAVQGASAASGEEEGGVVKNGVGPPLPSATTATPLCPLGRLPPLAATYAWVHEPALRAAWMAHIMGVCGEGVFSLLQHHQAERDVCYDNCRLSPGVVNAGSLSSPPHSPPLHPHSADSTAPPCATVVTPAAATAVTWEGLHAEAASHPCLPCVAYADGRVSAALNGLLRVPLSTPRSLVPHTAEAAMSLTRLWFRLSCDFEQRLYTYLCYPLAGGSGPSPTTVSAGATSELPQTLTMSAWEAYLDFRYRAPAQRRCPPSTKQGNEEERRSQEEELHTGVGGRGVKGDGGASTTPSMTYATAAAVAAGYAVRDSPLYAAIMDLAAAMVLTELRRTCVCIVGNTHDEFSADAALVQRTGERRFAGVVGEGEERDMAAQRPSTLASHVMRVENEEGTQKLLAHGTSTSAAAASAAQTTSASGSVTRCASPPCLQRVLEEDLEHDPSLCCYVHQNMSTLRTSATPTFSSQSAAPCPYCIDRDGCTGNQGESLRVRQDTNIVGATPASTEGGCVYRRAYAAMLWLSLGAVLSVGESGVAQYLRGVLLPPTCVSLSSSAGAATTASAAADRGACPPASLAPFTMPTLFCSTLEDLYKEEGLLRSRHVSSLSVPVGNHKEVRDRCSEARMAAMEGLPLPNDDATAEVAEMGYTSVAVAAALAVRHPRLLLRQVHFLWCLSCEGTTSATDARVQALQQQQQQPERTASGREVIGGGHGCRDEYVLRVSSLVECVQLAACNGLPAPLATSLTPCVTQRRKADDEEAARSGRLRSVEVHGAPTDGAATPCTGVETAASSQSGVTRARLRGNATAMTSPTSLQQRQRDSPPSGWHAAAPAPRAGAARPRLQLQLSSPAPVSVTTSGDDTTAYRTRQRSPRDFSDAQEDRHAVDDDARPADPLPALEGLADVRVRCACHTAVTSSSSPPSETSLLTLVSTVLWDAMRHIAAYQPQPSTLPFFFCCSAADTTAAQPGTSHGTGTRGAASPGALRPPRRALMLHLAPAYAELQRLWQALRLPPAARHKERVAGHASSPSLVPSVGCNEGPVLEVVLPPLTEEAAHSSAPESEGRRRSTYADLRCYGTLAASLRGVVCVSLGYAVYAVLHRTWEAAMWASTASRTAAKSNHDDGCSLATLEADLDSTETPSQTQTPLTTSYMWLTFPSSPGAAGPALATLTWLAAQLRTLDDEVLHPVNRICTVYAGDSLTQPQRCPRAPLSPLQRGDAGEATVKDLDRPPRPPPEVTAAWLAYGPYAHVLFPALIHAFDAVLLPATTTTTTAATLRSAEQADPQASVLMERKEEGAKSHPHGALLRDAADHQALEKATQEVRAAWLGVRRSLQQAGVAVAAVASSSARSLTR